MYYSANYNEKVKLMINKGLTTLKMGTFGLACFKANQTLSTTSGHYSVYFSTKYPHC